jgi:hypothetical protein
VGILVSHPESSKFQAPTSREASNNKLQEHARRDDFFLDSDDWSLGFGIWCFGLRPMASTVLLKRA